MAKAVASFPKGRRVKKILHLWTNRLYCTLSSFPGLSKSRSQTLQYANFNTSVLQVIRDGGGGNKRSREPHPTVISWAQTLKDQISGRSELDDTPLIFCYEPRPTFPTELSWSGVTSRPPSRRSNDQPETRLARNQKEWVFNLQTARVCAVSVGANDVLQNCASHGFPMRVSE